MRLRATILLLAAAQLCPAQSAGKPYWRDEAELWVAGNDSIEIAIRKTSGTLERLLDKVSQEDYCNQVVRGVVPASEFPVGRRIAGLTLFDELKQQEYSDLAQNARISRPGAETGPEGISIWFDKTFSGADFQVTETFQVTADHLRWEVRVHKTAGADRTVRVVQFAPLPLGPYAAWAPISDAPFSTKPYLPFAIEYGQSVSGSVGESRWRTNIPLVVFYSRQKKRAISFTSPFEVPAVRIRFLNNTSATSDFHWNSRQYPPRERPYFQVSNEYLGLRDNRDIRTGLLIATHPSDWRPALGWVYSKYRRYFDPAPSFDRWDGVYVMGSELMRDAQTDAERRQILDGRRERGTRWEELHGHFPWYGLMIPAPEVKTWFCESHRGATMTREKIAAHARLNNEFGIGTFIYYNITEAEHRYAEKEFPESIARDEDGKPVGAYRAEQYPGDRACWLMNADPSAPFGQHMIRQARQMVEAYPAMAGFFWDVYGRSYMFDFAHDDGITMVNNKPAYYPEFMYQRMMRDHIGPLLRGKGMGFTANKPVTIASCEGLDGIMAIENTPDEEVPAWIAAQSYLGLTRHVMILDGASGTHAELLLLNCLRYGMFYSDIGTSGPRGGTLPAGQIAANARLAKTYLPFIQRFRGKKWIFHPEALELPRNTDGNIFRLKDGSVMIPMVSFWRSFRRVDGSDQNVPVICRLPDAADMQYVYAASLDLAETRRIEPERSGDTLKIAVPRHGKATVILLSPRPDPDLEAALNSQVAGRSATDACARSQTAR